MWIVIVDPDTVPLKECSTKLCESEKDLNGLVEDLGRAYPKRKIYVLNRTGFFHTNTTVTLSEYIINDLGEVLPK